MENGTQDIEDRTWNIKHGEWNVEHRNNRCINKPDNDKWMNSTTTSGMKLKMS